MKEAQELTFEKYLYRMNHTEQSVKSYCYQVGNFLTANPGCENYLYKDILNVLEELAKQKPNVAYRIAILSAIKKYYDYLIEIGKRNDHPCRRIFIKSQRKKSVFHQDLFTSDELEFLMSREERYPNLKLKNQVIISLLIYQGLTSGEIANMKLQHINLEEGRIYVKESRDLTRRHLEMHPRQHWIFDNYINKSRVELLRGETDKLLVGKLGVPITTGEIGYLLEQFWSLYPDRKLNPSTVRQSVISNWLNEKKLLLENVQLMAGHRWISTTARYRQKPADERRVLINRFHPLG